ncbi:MAG: ArnT family glycosyltransferase [Lysobacterales bacterium]
MSVSLRAALLAALAIVFIGAGIGLKDPWPSDEPRFALVAWEMVDSGEWFFPRRGGELYPDKPPLYMWCQAVVLKFTGSIRLAHTLPSLIFGLITLLLVFDLTRRLYNPQIATVAGLILLATPQFVLESRAGQLDAMVTAWIALGVYSFLRHFLLGPSPRWLLVGFAACGFGIITKGVGFLPLLMLLLLPLLRRDERSGRVTPMLGVGGVLLMLAAACCWFLPMIWLVAQNSDPAYLAYRDNILFQQTAERYVSPSHHFKPPWYFITHVIPALWLPVFLLLPALVPDWYSKLRNRDPATLLLLGWAALVILFFSLSPAKRGVYILPALPWVCVAAAPALATLSRHSWSGKLGWLFPTFLGSLLTAAALWLEFGDPQRAEELTARYDLNLVTPLLIAGAGILLVTGLTFRRRFMPFLAMMGVLWLTIGLWIYPRLDGLKSGRNLLLKVERQLDPGVPLALVHWKEQTILQARRATTNFGYLVEPKIQAHGAVHWLAANPQGKVLLQEEDLKHCFENGFPVNLGVAHRRQWRLVDRSNVSCALPEITPAAAIEQYQVAAIQQR